jgi:pregnancy-associated plasma protein-A/type IX secretion system substrate protein
MQFRSAAPLCALLLAGALAVPSYAAKPAAPELISGRACATPEPSAQEMDNVRAAIDQWRSTNLVSATGGQIKVAFHVITSGNEGNLTDAQIAAQITELNRAYSGYYGGTNTGYTFVLASVDRTKNKNWFKMTPGSGFETQAKQALATDVPHRLNIYSCKPGQSLLGWAYFPDSYPEGDFHHGVVIHYGSVPGGYLSPYNLGGTADHEVGHYLGLYHTFQGGCAAPGDAVSDTPAEATATSGCPIGKDTCAGGGADPIHNYMDYSDDACYSQFTSGQDQRMDGIVPVYRPSLLNAARVILAANRPALGAPAADLSFRGAFPNPFRDATTVRFALPQAGHASLRVYDVAGHQVAVLADRDFEAGEQAVTFRPQGLAAGMYFLSLRVSGAQLARSVILVR